MCNNNSCIQILYILTNETERNDITDHRAHHLRNAARPSGTVIHITGAPRVLAAPCLTPLSYTSLARRSPFTRLSRSHLV
ncbi:hypothetical protein HanRHA438_Chr12g0546861 [Helianthus annuus]|nr:hypothetical protein HanRHA438_Chr12g0546861 [Helianthus annuus]